MFIRPGRRDVLRLGAAAALLQAPAIAQAWPAKPIRIVVTYPPGGLTACAKVRKLSLATYGAGSYAHVVAETLNRHFGLKMEAVHYRGEALMWQDVASGAVQSASGSYAAMLPFVQSGAVRIIAVPTLERMKKLPDVATLYEPGLTQKAFHERGS